MEIKDIADVYQDESFESIDSCEKVLLNLTQLGNKPRCKYHPRNEIILLCLQSQWHCEELCVDCVQQHVEQHKMDGQPANLKNVDEAVQLCKQKVDSSLENYKAMQERIKIKQAALKNNYSDSFTQSLDLIEQEVIEQVHQSFLQVKQNYMSKIKDFINDKRQLLRIIQGDIKEQTDRIVAKLEAYENDQLKAVKDIYFKNFERDITHQEHKEEEYECYQPSIRILKNDDRLASLQEQINQIFYIKQEIENKSKSKHTGKTQQQKLKEKLKNEIEVKKDTERQEKKNKQLEQGDKKTKCPVCRNQMVYVSNFKKHLSCLQCKNDKRLYSEKSRG